MSLIAYCYGPFSTKKNLFCSHFAKSNSEYKLIELHKVRKKTIGSYLPIDKKSEEEVKKEFEKNLLIFLNKKNKILINGLFLNKEARILFNNSIKNLTKEKFKIVSIAFPAKNLAETFEENKKTRLYKDMTFDQLRLQSSLFSLASDEQEANLLINEIDGDFSNLEINTKLWNENRIIHCNSLKKVAEYILYGSSF
jgi:hypothetical protein